MCHKTQHYGKLSLLKLYIKQSLYNFTMAVKCDFKYSYNTNLATDKSLTQHKIMK